MADEDFAADRIIIKFDPGRPIELTNLTNSFAALARLYERHHRTEGEGAPKLFVTRLETGSIIAEIAPYLIMMGTAVVTMDSAVIVADFTNRLFRGIRAFAGPPAGAPSTPQETPPPPDDAADIREFVHPLIGKRGASLGIKHARLETKDGERTTLVEYTFDENELNRAVINIDEALTLKESLFHVIASTPEIGGPIKREVMLFFEQASRKPGKPTGKTVDRGIVPEVSDKHLPVHFRESIQNLKDQMVRSEPNPLTSTFVVDVHVQMIDGVPKGYIVTDVHKIIPADDT